MTELDAQVTTPTKAVHLRGLPAPWSRLLREHGPVSAVLIAFFATLFIVPTMTDAPVSDDWVYSRSVEILLHQQHLHILDLSVVTLVFQVIWGAIFSILFGTSFGSMRLSTLMLFAMSGVSLNWLLRGLGVERSRAAFGVAVYLFNPLTFVLAFSFMTDPQFLSLLVIATAFYVRGLNPDDTPSWAVIAGSIAASCAFLTRQQGILIPLAVGLYLLFARRWKPNREGVLAAIRVAGIPALTMLAYYVWILGFQGAPTQQSAFLNQIFDAGFSDSRILASRMTWIEIAYIGFFVCPIILASLPRIWNMRLPHSWPGFAVMLAWVGITVSGLIVFGSQHRLMPYIPQFFGRQGVGPTDLIGGRETIFSIEWARLFTVVCAISATAFIIFVSGRIGDAFTPERAGAALLTNIGLWQVFGILPPSYHFRNWIISVDRYLIPMIPFAICLLLWALHGRPMFLPVGWAAIAVFAIFSVVSTHDFLVFQNATWEFAQESIDKGVPITSLDAGSSWDGYHLYDYSVEHHIQQQTPHGPWWTNLFAPATNSDYVIATSVPAGYTEVDGFYYKTWMDSEGHWLWLSRREGVPGPP